MAALIKIGVGRKYSTEMKSNQSLYYFTTYYFITGVYVQFCKNNIIFIFFFVLGIIFIELVRRIFYFSDYFSYSRFQQQTVAALFVWPPHIQRQSDDGRCSFFAGARRTVN
jgi:hypothetical protein